jgi:hypothetical protein
MTPCREKSIAFHEAGHAVVARALGIGLIRVTIFPTAPNEVAGCETEPAELLAYDADMETMIAALENSAKVSMAGPLAQLKHQRRYRSDSLKHWQTDIANALADVVQIAYLHAGIDARSLIDVDYTPSKAVQEAIWTHLNGETRTLVDANWIAIARVAAALIEHRALSQKDVDKLIKGETP